MSKQQEVTIVPYRNNPISPEWILVAVAFILAVSIWIFASHRSEAAPTDGGDIVYTEGGGPELEVTFLDVGQGDCAFIRTPSGHTVLVDAGPGKGKYSYYDAGERVIVPFLRARGIKKIDTLLMTHPHADHYGGMNPVMRAVKVGEFLDPGLDHPTEAYVSVLKTVERKKIPFKIIQAPEILTWDPDMLVQILWPDQEGYVPTDPNNNSIVVRMVYGDVVYLLTGDIEKLVEEQLYAYRNKLRTTVLKIPHHGSQTSSTRRFLEFMNPRLAVMSLAMNNSFGFPDEDVEARYKKMEIPIVRTDRSGTIKTLCNGKRIRVLPELGRPFTIYPFPEEPPVPEKPPVIENTVESKE